MKQLLTVVIFAIFIFACTRNAITGRSQLSLVSEKDLQGMALTQYADFLSKNKVVISGKDDGMVKSAGNRIVAAIKKYYTDKGIVDELADYQWEFNLVQGNEVNAWCMPGGKVVIYTGLLPVTQTETGLAVVMGHEIAHAVASHGRERMSQQLAAQGIGQLGGVALSSNQQAAGIFNSVYGIGAEYGILLPFSRKQELEADKYGLLFAAMAGYDPKVAIDVWTRMANLNKGQKPPAILSSHPSDEDRIRKIKELMPEALQYYSPK